MPDNEYIKFGLGLGIGILITGIFWVLNYQKFIEDYSFGIHISILTLLVGGVITVFFTIRYRMQKRERSVI